MPSLGTGTDPAHWQGTVSERAFGRCACNSPVPAPPTACADADGPKPEESAGPPPATDARKPKDGSSGAEETAKDKPADAKRDEATGAAPDVDPRRSAGPSEAENRNGTRALPLVAFPGGKEGLPVARPPPLALSLRRKGRETCGGRLQTSEYKLLWNGRVGSNGEAAHRTATARRTRTRACPSSRALGQPRTAPGDGFGKNSPIPPAAAADAAGPLGARTSTGLP